MGDRCYPCPLRMLGKAAFCQPAGGLSNVPLMLEIPGLAGYLDRRSRLAEQWRNRHYRRREPGAIQPDVHTHQPGLHDTPWSETVGQVD